MDVQAFAFMLSTSMYFAIHIFPQGSVSPYYSPKAQQAPVSGARCVFRAPGGGVTAVLCWFPPQVFKTAPWLTSQERVQPAPLAPPTPANWHKGQGLETEARAQPAPLPTCPREQQQSCLCSALKCQGIESSSHPHQRVCLSQRAPSKY